MKIYLLSCFLIIVWCIFFAITLFYIKAWLYTYISESTIEFMVSGIIARNIRIIEKYLHSGTTFILYDDWNNYWKHDERKCYSFYVSTQEKNVCFYFGLVFFCWRSCYDYFVLPIPHKDLHLWFLRNAIEICLMRSVMPYQNSFEMFSKEYNIRFNTKILHRISMNN